METAIRTDITPNFHIPTQIYLKEDITLNTGDIVKKYGSRSVMVTTRTDFAIFHKYINKISDSLSKHNIGCIIYDEIPDTPNTEYIDSAISFIKKTNCDLIIGFGGIEAINSAKAISILINNYMFSDELFESSGLKSPINLLTIPAYPLFGFEILPMLYLTDINDMTIKMYKNDYLFPKGTIIDPKISLAIDNDIIAKNAVSTLAIATESVVSKKNNGIINSLSLRAVDLTFKNLPLVYREPENVDALKQLFIASIMSGFSFSIAELSISLSLALALASKTEIEVTSSMGIMLPHVMEYNLTASPGKYVQMSKVMDQDVKDITVIEAAIKAVEGVRKLTFDVDIPQRLSQFQITKSDFSIVSDIATSYPLIENAPRPLNKNEIETILIAAY